MRQDIRSFDVFDTVLTRTLGEPEAVIDVVAGRAPDQVPGASEVAPAVLAGSRVAAERALLELRGRQPALHEIWDEVVGALALEAAAADALARLELDVEREVSRAVPGARDLVQRARREGDRVVFVSDSPLAGEDLGGLLAEAGLRHPDDLVVTSADRGERKGGDGALFSLVAAELGVEPAAITHTGDNLASDVAAARQRGWRASHRSAGLLNRYERLLGRRAEAGGGVPSRLAGASRLARLRAVEDGVDPERAAVATGVVAPLLVGYALWLLRQAQQRDLRRLYFLSRDGEVVQEVVQALASALGQEVECRYLYGSRAAWRPASLHHRDPEDLADWLAGDPSSTPRTVLHRVGLSPEQAVGLVQDPLLRAPRCDQPLDAAGLARLTALVETGPLREELRRVAARAQALAADYLRQEGLDDGTRSAVVDVGWLGRTGGALVDVLDGAGIPLPEAFFLIGVRRGARRWSPPRLAERQVAWLFDHEAGHGLPGEPSGRVTLVESFCSGREGSTLGYERRDGRVEPVLVRPRNDAALDWGLDQVRTSVRLVVEELASGDPAPLRRPVDLRGAVDAVLREFWERPTPAEVAVWGSFPFEADDAHRRSIPLAAPVRWEDVAREARLGRLKLRPAGSWRAGTAQVSPPPWRQVIALAAAAQRHRSLPARLRRRALRERALRRG
ncbi:HAD family hydrolase [uncultured Pseudokineococcus sp.]|uniref:HAD family hydrolase n=1 Tax=uncultured Pseudokineococcus sp. TaxID=1642928 RepID=UPI002634E588|nr:HAD family hydrolase [uncultured Pseudokineococcus sp.]